MPNRPLNDKERVSVIEKIRVVKESIAIDQEYLANLETKLTQGEWYSDRNYILPFREPECYFCKHSKCGFCELSVSEDPIVHIYDVVCEDYKDSHDLS